MKVTRDTGRATIQIEQEEVELLRLALLRATFEDTPPGRQREILDFASALLRALETPAD